MIGANWDAIKVALDLVELVSLFIVAFYAWTQARAKANKEEIVKLRDLTESRMNLHSERLVRVEERIGVAPGEDEIQRLHDRISSVKEDVSSIRESVAGITSDVRGLRSAIDRIACAQQNGGKP